MPCSYRLLVILSLLFCLSIASPGLSGGNGQGAGGGFGGGEGGEAGLANATTDEVVKIITSGVERCRTIDPVYRFDCYRKTYRLAANFLNGRPAYADAQKALITVAETLEQIMARNGDPRVAPIRTGFQTFRPVKPASVPRARAELSRALDQAETVLLRAPERTGNHYARIAGAINSNKVLLRSRLYPNGKDLRRVEFA